MPKRVVLKSVMHFCKEQQKLEKVTKKICYLMKRINKDRNDYLTQLLDQAYQKRHMKEPWRLARICTNTGKGTKRRWQNCPITSRPTIEQTMKLLMKPTQEGGTSAPPKYGVSL